MKCRRRTPEPITRASVITPSTTARGNRVNQPPSVSSMPSSGSHTQCAPQNIAPQRSADRRVHLTRGVELQLRPALQHQLQADPTVRQIDKIAGMIAREAIVGLLA